MLDMGFLPDIRRVLKHLPAAAADALLLARRCRRRSSTLTREMLHEPGDRSTSSARPAPAVGHHAGGLPGRAGAQGAAARSSSSSAARSRARSSSRAPSTAPTGSPSCLAKHGVAVRAHPRQPHARRSAPQALAGFKSGQLPRARRDRHRRARHRRRGARPRRQLRRARTCRRTTSTASAARRAPS